MPDDKKKQAMSLLFGDAPARPDPAPEKPKPARKKVKRGSSVAKTTGRQSSPAPVSKESETPNAIPRQDTSEMPSGERGGTTPAPEADVTPDPYYQGASRYRRASGEQVKHSVYLDPDVSQAIKVAAAMGNDPRGTNVSAIVNEALRELGYGA